MHEARPASGLMRGSEEPGLNAGFRAFGVCPVWQHANARASHYSDIQPTRLALAAAMH